MLSTSFQLSMVKGNQVRALADFQRLTEIQAQVLGRLNGEPVFYDHFYFTGGTALKALGIVPRESNDLDFFTFSGIEQMKFPAILVDLKRILDDELGGGRLENTDKGFLDRETGMTIDFVLDSIPAIDEFTVFDHVSVSGFADIGANKSSALCCRDEVKDYVDIAFLTLDRKWTLVDLAESAEKKFRLGTVTVEKLVEELVNKRQLFQIQPKMFLIDGEKNVELVNHQIDLLLNSVQL